MNQNLCFEYQQLMSRYNNIQLELKKNDSQHQRQQIKKEKLSKELKNNKNNNLKVKEMPTQQHHRLNFSKLFKNIKPAPVVVPAEEAVVVPAEEAVVVPAEEAVVVPAEEAVVVPVAPAAMKNIILFKALQQIMFKRQ
jgi:hypothetical protein